MNDVGAAPSLPDGVPNHRLPDESRRDSHPQPPASSPPALNGDGRKTPDAAAVDDEEASGRADSEAETIIQSGREELSPEKRKPVVQHTVDQEEERRDFNDSKTMAVAADEWNARKRRRVEGDANGEGPIDDSSSSRASSRPISKRSSPSRQLKREKTEDSPIRSIARGSSPDEPSISKVADANKPVSSGGIIRVGEERAVGPEADSDHQHASDPSRNEEPEETNNSSYNNNISYAPRASKTRSTSPLVPFHKRTSSGSLSSSIHPQKKKKQKRAPPPLLTDHPRHRSEDRDSNSSRSGSPLTAGRGGKATSVDLFSASSAKHPAMRRRDQNGRTRLARACAAQETQAAKTFHANQPEDLNIPDNAGNTPLQVAALEGCVELVKYLLDAGCDISTKNIDKDTPLIDAVENGHLEVVKLLLDAGVNPRAGNAQGDEPFDLVPSDSEHYDEIRRVIKEAKSRTHSGLSRRRSEDSAGKDHQSHDATGTRLRDSTAGSRRKTVRSEATRNDLLWTSATPENLRDFAAKGDMAGVATILNVLPKADTESLIAAAKGGHDEVLGILLGMGDPDPDPKPLQSGNHKPGYDTPMRAAIGRGNTQVIRLLLDQPGFDPTCPDHLGRKYYELSQERKGERWEEEFQFLKDAYDNHNKSPKSRKPAGSSPRRSRDKVSVSSFSKEGTTIKEKKRRGSMEKPNQKPRRRDSLHVASTQDHDVAQPSMNRKSLLSLKDKPQEDDASSTRGQEHVKRRRLIAGRPPLDYHRERRASLMSSDSHSSREEVHKEKAEESANMAHSPLKRSRSSLSPEPGRQKERSFGEHDLQENKRRRVQSDEDVLRTSEDSLKVESHGKHSHLETVSNGHSDDGRTMQRRVSDAAAKQKTSSGNVKPVDSGAVFSEEDIRGLDLRPTRDLPTTPLAEIETGSAKEFNEPGEPGETDEAREAREEREAREAKEAREAQEAKEAEERRLVEEAERERREREAKEEEEAREAAERAARVAREKAEEEERKRKEAELRRIRQAEEEHQKRLEQERLRQAKLRREQEEQERKRREALPHLLRAAADFIGSNDPRAKDHRWLKYLLPVCTVTAEQLDPSCDPEVKEERWTANYQVAPLLGTNDLQLSQYPSWEKRTATPTQRNNLWRVTGTPLSYCAVLNPLVAKHNDYLRRWYETLSQFQAMEHIFWVKLSDFMDLVPHIPHLQGFKLDTQKIYIDPEPPDGIAKPESLCLPDLAAHERIREQAAIARSASTKSSPEEEHRQDSAGPH